MCVIYVIEQNIKLSSSYVYHRLYFTHKLKNPIIKPHKKISKEPTQITVPGSDVLVSPLYLVFIKS